MTKSKSSHMLQAQVHILEELDEEALRGIALAVTMGI